jgi:hypothetical protein
MSTSKKAAVVKGAVMLYLQPMMATDAQIDLDSLLSGVTNRNYAAKIPELNRAIHKSLRGKLAWDANTDGLFELLNALRDVPEPEGDNPDTDEEDDLDGVDQEPLPPAALAFLRNKLDPEDLDEFMRQFAGTGQDRRRHAMDSGINPDDEFLSRFPGAKRIGWA